MATVLTPGQRERDHEALMRGIDAICKSPIVIGFNDCVAFAANIHVAAGRPDFFWRQRNTYSTPEGMAKALTSLGLYYPLGVAADEQDWRKIAPVDSELLDIGIVKTEVGQACVIRGVRNWLAPVDYGFSELPNECVRRAWSVSECRQ